MHSIEVEFYLRKEGIIPWDVTITFISNDEIAKQNVLLSSNNANEFFSNFNILEGIFSNIPNFKQGSGLAGISHAAQYESRRNTHGKDNLYETGAEVSIAREEFWFRQRRVQANGKPSRFLNSTDYDDAFYNRARNIDW